MKPARSTWVVSLVIFAFLLLLRLMIQGSSRPEPETAPVEEPPTPEPIESQPATADAPAPAVEYGTSSSGQPNGVRRRLATFAVTFAMASTLLTVGAGSVFADQSVNSPGKVQDDTTQLNWSGQGAPVDQKCGDNADPGAGGYQNGATADNYMLWIFTTDGGGITGTPTLTINGTNYSNAHATGQWQIVTPYVDPSTISDAHTNFVVDATGNGSWILTISHGCGGGTVEDQIVDPHGSIFGPCLDPAYYATFDNTASTVPVKFRLRWITTHGLNVKVRMVPGGSMWTTWQHWAKPGTYVKLAYKDPNTNVWTQLDRVLVQHGRFPACEYQPGWSAQ